MPKKNENSLAMYKMYELRDSLKTTHEAMLKGLENESQLIELINKSDMKDTEFGKQLIEQTTADIENRHKAEPRLLKKVETLDTLIAGYENADEEKAKFIDSIVAMTLEILGA